VKVSDREAFDMTRRLAKEEGILAGGSSGAAVAAALKVAKRLGRGKTVVVILPDTGRSYLNKVYNDEWMAEEGFISAKGERVSVAEVLDYKPENLCMVIGVSPDDPLSAAITKLKEFDISQLPVIQDGIQVGSITASSVLAEIASKKHSLDTRVEDMMEAPLPTVDRKAKLLDPAMVLREKNALVVVDGTKIVGILTMIDVINYLAKS